MHRMNKETGYLAVMGICLVCCAVLLVSVATDRPLVAAAPTHVPVLRTDGAASHRTAEEALTEDSQKQEALSRVSSGCLLTGERLEAELADFLPESFPVTGLEAALEGEQLSLSFSMERAALRDYLEEQGIPLSLRQSLLLQLLPHTLRAEATFALWADADGLHLRPAALTLGERAVSLSALPENAFSALDQGINALLQAAGVSFSRMEVTPEGLLLS